ncbi:hypothetical protein [Nocardioides sp. Leaf285]|uniref:hypothetical protein n=1 Tax=Nocardioides sp. Leaf285 TaxID=1736322 RepID=UPI000702B237|nr:hypothetical protein [Nocardioides sp. Leaf285]KQP63183.1 hypothetical protein ASF47_19425 [Nocardioides sp. Leaf285]
MAPLNRTETGDRPYLVYNTTPGNWVKQDGFASDPSTQSSLNSMTVVDVGSPDGYIQGDFGFGRTASNALYVRVVDGRNWIRLRVDFRNVGEVVYTLVLESAKNGAITEYGRFSMADNPPWDIRVTMSGTTISSSLSYYSGGSRVSGPSATITDYATATKHGIGEATSTVENGASGFDKFTIQAG